MGLLDDLANILIPGYALAKVATEQAAPGKTLSVENALTTGKPQDILTEKKPGAPGFALDFLDQLIQALQKDPKSLVALVPTLIKVAAAVAVAISFIPTTNNVGGPLASRLISGLIGPFETSVYTRPTEDFLDNFFPTREAPARLLVSGIEAGAIREEDLVEELVDAGTKDRSIRTISAFARVKRYEAATKDDLALVRQYQFALQTATIQTLQDEVRQTINDLLDRRKEIERELRSVRAKGS